jgi:hypothetical protein
MRSSWCRLLTLAACVRYHGLLTILSGCPYRSYRFRGHTVRLYPLPRYPRLQKWIDHWSFKLSFPLHSLPGRFLLLRHPQCIPQLECIASEYIQLYSCYFLEMHQSHCLPSFSWRRGVVS